MAIGEIADFNRELVEGLLRDLVENSELKGAKVRVVVDKAEVRCYGCNSLWGFKDLIEPLPEDFREMVHFVPELLSSFTKCPKCGSQDLHIESGRSVRIVEVQLERPHGL